MDARQYEGRPEARFLGWQNARGKWPERLSALRPPLAKLSLRKISLTPPRCAYAAMATLGRLANVCYEVPNQEFQRG
jgi:hypothetical protein